MIKILTTACTFLLSGHLFAQSAPADTIYNLGYENTTNDKPLPNKWTLFYPAPNYKCETTTLIKHSGSRSLLIEQTGDIDNKTFGSVRLAIPAKFAGKEIEFRSWLKFEDVQGFVGILIRVDNALPKLVEFKILQGQQIKGTEDWKQYSIKANIPIDAQTIYVASILNGPGKLWVDDGEILIDGKDISQAKPNPDFDPKRPAYGNNAKASGTVRLKDASIYYETYGHGQPLLLLHGNSQNIYAFNFQIGELAKKYKVIAVDTRGQGKSKDDTTGPLSYDLVADDMRQLMDSLHIKKASILGWSDGGNTGLIMAVKYPGYVNKLATMGANLFPTTEAIPDTVLNQIKALVTMYNKQTSAKAKMQGRLFTMLLQEPHLTYADVKKIKARVLVMAGEKDLITDKHTRAIAAAIPKSQLVIFKGATHYAPVEIVKEFNGTVMKFFGQ